MMLVMKIFTLFAVAGKGDILLVFSGSGNSQNVINAIETARTQNMKTAAVLGLMVVNASRWWIYQFICG